MTDSERLENLLRARHPLITLCTCDEHEALAVVRRAALERGQEMWIWSMNGGLRDGLLDKSPCIADTDHPAAALYRICDDQLARMMIVMLDIAGHLKDERTRRMLREAIDAVASRGASIVLIDCIDDLPPAIAAMATRFELSLPNETELEELIRSTLRRANDEQRISVSLNRNELSTIVRNLRGLSQRQARQIIVDCIAHDRKFDADDLNQILAEKRQALSGASLLEYVEAPTELTAIGGLNRLKSWLSHREDALSDEAIAFGVPAARGVLMLGVQGAGKSLAAKAIATAWRRPLLRMDVGALYDKYIGESERRLRVAFRQAEAMAPIVLWIDEIEKAFASAAAQSTDGGLSKRMFGELLTWMQEHTAPVFLVATANDIEALPPELLRKGRFDEIFFVDLPTREARIAIFEIHLKKRKRDPAKFDLNALADAADGYSGAEIEAAIIAALYDAFAAKQALSNEFILAALKASPPLSATMREKVAELRQWSRGRCAPAD